MLKLNKEFQDTLRHGREFLRALRNYKYETTDDGSLYLPEQKTLVKGMHEHYADDGLGLIQDPNLIVTEGLNHIWTSTVNGGTQLTSWYIAIHSGTSSPAAGWTAANYASNATELTTQYSDATRRTWTGSAAASGSTNNTASKGVFTSATTSVTVWGAALLSSPTKGGTTGTLLSASKFGAARTLAESGDTISIGITLTATSS